METPWSTIIAYLGQEEWQEYLNEVTPMLVGSDKSTYAGRKDHSWGGCELIQVNAPSYFRVFADPAQ